MKITKVKTREQPPKQLCNKYIDWNSDRRLLKKTNKQTKHPGLNKLVEISIRLSWISSQYFLNHSNIEMEGVFLHSFYKYQNQLKTQ